MDLSPLWDFTGYDVYSTEAVLLNRQHLKWFWAPAHYTTALGNLIIARIFTPETSSFCSPLSMENVESHLRTIRDQRRLYREHDPTDVQRIRDLYNLVSTTKSRSVTHGP